MWMATSDVSGPVSISVIMDVLESFSGLLRRVTRDNVIPGTSADDAAPAGSRFRVPSQEN